MNLYTNTVDYITPKRFEIHGGSVEEATDKKGKVIERIFRSKYVVTVTAKNPEELGFLFRRDDKLRNSEAIRIYER